MSVLVAAGWYDEPVGHMIYIQIASLAKLKNDVAAMQQALKEGAPRDLSPTR